MGWKNFPSWLKGGLIFVVWSILGALSWFYIFTNLVTEIFPDGPPGIVVGLYIIFMLPAIVPLFFSYFVLRTFGLVGDLLCFAENCYVGTLTHPWGMISIILLGIIFAFAFGALIGYFTSFLYRKFIHKEGKAIKDKTQS